MNLKWTKKNMMKSHLDRITTNEDGELQYDLTNIEIYWLEAFEQLDDEQLKAVFVAWEIESTDRWAKELETNRTHVLGQIEPFGEGICADNCWCKEEEE